MKPLRLILLPAALLLLANTALAQQDIEQMLYRQQISCSDIALNSSEMIPRFIGRGEMDSALMVLKVWQEKCGNSEPVMRANLLLALNLHYYDESYLPDNFTRLMNTFHNRLEIASENSAYIYNYYQKEFDFVPVGGVFDQWTQEFAASMVDYYEPGTEGFLLCSFYSGNTNAVYKMLLTPQYADTKPGRLYNKEVGKALNLPALAMGLTLGTWIPTARLSDMGIHPELGFTYGVKHRNNSYDLVMAVKFVRTPSDYLARRDKDSPQELTHNFTGGYFGFEYARNLIPNRKNSPIFSAGIAYDGITMFSADEKNDIKASSANSYNFNFGGGYNLALNKHSALGIQLRYNIVDYTLNKLFDKHGHVFTVRLSYSFSQNQYRESLLNSLNYYE